MTKVLIIDDQKVAREYMERIVEDAAGYECIGSISNADMAEVICRRYNADLVLMDVCNHGKEDGIDAAEHLRKLYPQLKIIIVTSMPEESFLRRAIEAGADGFWHKETDRNDLISVMNDVMDGKKVWSQSVPVIQIGKALSTDFTETEMKVLRLVCEGMEYSEMAKKLNYSRDTVKYHISAILAKTGYTNKTQLAIAVTGKHLIIPKLLDEKK